MQVLKLQQVTWLIYKADSRGDAGAMKTENYT